MTKFSYIGIDETTLGLDKGNLIVVAAETNDPKLVEEKSYIKKAQNYVAEAKEKAKNEYLYDYDVPREEYQMPSIKDLKGLEKFYWIRATRGRFSRQIMEHSSIAYVISQNGLKPQNTVLYIDAFYGNEEKSKYLIKEALHMRDFKIPEKNIELVRYGDCCIPIINYADLIAFQIGFLIHSKYKEFSNKKIDLPFSMQEIEFDEQRVVSVDEEGRSVLEMLIEDSKK
ncbi:hypothetical protein ACFL1H_02630 [Nanoarchaeota archaeon]